MLKVDTIHEVRMAHFVKGKSIREICRAFGLARNTVRTLLRTGKAILASGHDLKMMKEILKQTEGRGVNVYNNVSNNDE